jgi:NTP pyrophosphatase (non-canonical NTP hydrolase)
MIISEYEARAALTAPDSAVMHLNMVPPKALYGVSMALISFERDVNALKKILVYGSKAPAYDGLAVYESRDASPFKPGKDFNAKVAHGVIGITSEVLEVLQGFVTVLFGEDDLDIPNMKEEVGDILWYLARLSKACGFTLAEAMEANIAKLEVRHLSKTGGFNPDAATEGGRDRIAEKAASETASDRVAQSFEKRMSDLGNLVDIASSPGNADANEYLRGMANGLILAHATMHNLDPVYIQQPKGNADTVQPSEANPR